MVIYMALDESSVDLFFRVEGHVCDVDHGYTLFSAISQCVDRPPDHLIFHQNTKVGLHRLRGQYLGRGKLRLGAGAFFGLRLPRSRVADALILSGKTLTLNKDSIKVGTVFTRELIPASTLYAHMVTTRNGETAERFLTEIQRQCDALAICGRIDPGPRRIFTIKGKKIVGFALLVSELSAEESLRLQEKGLGGRRRMGCGVFSLWQR